MTRRGGVLLEVLLALALFLGAGAFALSAVRSVFAAIERAELEQKAVDLARSKMAELEAGLISLADLRGGTLREVGSHSLAGRSGRAAELSESTGWLCEVNTRRSEFDGLTLVELTIREESDDPSAISFTLRQLVRLREIDPEGYEQDELFDSLRGGRR